RRRFGDRLSPLGGAEHAPRIDAHQLFEAQVGKRLLRQRPPRRCRDDEQDENDHTRPDNGSIHDTSRETKGFHTGDRGDGRHFWPAPGVSWTRAASDSSFELSCSRERRARSRLRSKRILPFSTKTCAMPPRRAKSSPSPIVSTDAPRTAATTLPTCDSFRPETNSRWQPRSGLPGRTRCTTIWRPDNCRPLTTRSSASPTGPSSSTQALNEPDAGSTSSGHSVNLAKL